MMLRIMMLNAKARLARADRRRQRAMMREYCRPWTGRMALVVAVLMACAALWVVAPPAMAALYTVTVDDYANIREEPSKLSVDAGDVLAGETVTGIGYSQGWVQIKYSVEAMQGWVREDLLTLADYPTGRYTNISGGRVHVRAEPDGDHAHWLAAGRSVDVIRWVDVDGEAWAYTKKGYIKSDCLEVAQ